MNEVMLKGAYIKKQYEEHIFGWESTLLGLRKNREEGKKRLYAKVSEDTLAIVLIIDALLFICFLGFLLFFIREVIQLIFNENPVWPFYLFATVLFSLGAIMCAYPLNKRMLEAYTAEKEQRILDDLDKAFKSTEESTPQGKTK